MMTNATTVRALPGIFAAAVMAALLVSAGAAPAAEEQYFGVPSSRVGPYSAMGTGYYGGIIDYMNYVNMTGGVNGVQLTWEECETEYNAARTVECYQRLLHKGDQKMVVFDTLGTPGAYAVIGRMAPDNVVLAQFGYGRTDAADGRVWPWVFGAHSNYWSQIARAGCAARALVHGTRAAAGHAPDRPTVGFQVGRNSGAASRTRTAVPVAADPPRES